MTEQQIKDFLVKELDLEGMSDKEQDEMISRFGELILKRMVVASLERLPEDKQGDFSSLVEEGNAAKVSEFLSVHIPDLEGFLQNEMQAFVQEYKDFQKSLD